MRYLKHLTIGLMLLLSVPLTALARDDYRDHYWNRRGEYRERERDRAFYREMERRRAFQREMERRRAYEREMERRRAYQRYRDQRYGSGWYRDYDRYGDRDYRYRDARDRGFWRR